MTRMHRAAVLAAALFVAPAYADEWKHEVAPYLWLSGMSGRSGVGNAVVDVDASFSDLFENIEASFMGMYRGTKGRYSIMLDAMYVGLGKTGTGPSGFVKGDLDIDQTTLEADFGYALTEQFHVFAGVRYLDLSLETSAVGPLGSRSSNAGKSWVDPVVGAHFTLPMSDQWSLNLRGDVAGFGVGSEMTWQGIATLRWQATERLGVLAAYRYMDSDYEDGDGTNKFVYDIALSGPAVGVVFTF